MRQTAKYRAAIRIARDLKLGLRAGSTSHEAAYSALEGRGYWWDAESQEWSNSPRPSTSIFTTDYEGDTPSGVIRLRVMGHPSDVSNTVESLRLRGGLRVIEQSDPYPNRKGPGVRVYLTVMGGKP